MGIDGTSSYLDLHAFSFIRWGFDAVPRTIPDISGYVKLNWCIGYRYAKI